MWASSYLQSRPASLEYPVPDRQALRPPRAAERRARARHRHTPGVANLYRPFAAPRGRFQIVRAGPAMQALWRTAEASLAPQRSLRLPVGLTPTTHRRFGDQRPRDLLDPEAKRQKTARPDKKPA